MFRRWRILARRYPGHAAVHASAQALLCLGLWDTVWAHLHGKLQPFALAIAETYLNPTYLPIVLASLSALVWGAWKIPQERRR